MILKVFEVAFASLFVTKAKSHFKKGFHRGGRNCRAGRLREWSQGKLRLYVIIISTLVVTVAIVVASTQETVLSLSSSSQYHL